MPVQPVRKLPASRSAGVSPASEKAGGTPAVRRLRVPQWIDWITQPRPKARTALRFTLLASIVLHLSLVPLAARNGGLSPEQMKNLDSEYNKKIGAARTASVVSRQLRDKLTMPPPPPEPESVINHTLTQSLGSDIEKVIGSLLDVKVTSKLKDQVTASLKEELGQASQKIARGELSEAEIQALHERFKKKAHEQTVTALKEHRVETQVENASVSTTEWYEGNLSRSLMWNIMFELHTPPNYNRHPPSPNSWGAIMTGGVDRPDMWKNLDWGSIRSNEILVRKLGELSALTKGIVGERRNAQSGKSEPVIHAAWPGPNPEQAAYLAARLAALHKGAPRNRASRGEASWRAVVHGGLDEHAGGALPVIQHLTSGLAREFFPHHEAEFKEITAAADAAWEPALAAVNSYLKCAESAGPEASGELRKAQQDAFQALAELESAARKLQLPGGRDAAERYQLVNALVRSQVLRGPVHEEMYETWVGQMVQGLTPVICDMVKGQFGKGILVPKEGVEKAMDDFPRQILPLLRRDIQSIMPRPKFDSMIFAASYPYRIYKNRTTGQVSQSPACPEDAKEDDALLARTLEAKPELAPYAEKRRAMIAQHLKVSLKNIKEHIMSRVLTGNLLMKNIDTIVEGVDYADKVQEKLDARAAALAGRGQDLARLTAGGVPDTSAPLIALFLGGSKGHGANLEPVLTAMEPAFSTLARPALAMRGAAPQFPPPAAKWGFREQAAAETIKPRFQTARHEGIPFLPNFPGIDGDLSDWGSIRPLFLQSARGMEQIPLYAAWNYQGFFFGYAVKQTGELFYYPSQSRAAAGSFDDFQMVKAEGTGWASQGDHLRLFFDTLDARNQNRGELHTQEFIIFPRGTDANPEAPGIERVIASQRDAKTKIYRGVKDLCKMFRDQPAPQQGPDGSGPYRVTRFREDGYSVEVFLPRSLFNVPVFAPGWNIGFDCAVGLGNQRQTNKGFTGQVWAAGGNAGSASSGLSPRDWGDLLLLGTDARVVVQNADEEGSTAAAVLPGHSYLLTVVDPDRNVNLAQEDTVIVSAELLTPGSQTRDVEVFILKETEKNSSVFRGYINTQPGAGREVQGVLEMVPGQTLRFGYVDFANSRGERNLIAEIKLPVVSGLLQTVNHGK